MYFIYSIDYMYYMYLCTLCTLCIHTMQLIYIVESMFFLYNVQCQLYIHKPINPIHKR